MSGKNRTCLIPKGILKSYIILVLRERPMHGYAIMNTISTKTKIWKPSPGTIYPLLASMTKKGLIEKRAAANKIVYTLTKKGRETARHISEIRHDFKKRSIETLLAVLTEKELFDMRKRFISRYFRDRKTSRLVKALYDFTVFTVDFYSKSDYEADEAEKIIKDAERKMRRLVKTGG
jgi:DNA-binding PadR family transcriptional regulator